MLKNLLIVPFFLNFPDLGVPVGVRTTSPPSETQDPERVSLLPGIIPTLLTADPENGCIGLQRAEFSGNVFPLMAEIIVLPYCPILSREKIQYFTTKKDEKSARKKRLLSCIFDILSYKIRKKGESGHFAGFFGKYSKRGGALECMYILRRDIPHMPT